jgi:hypothetical protein
MKKHPHVQLMLALCLPADRARVPDELRAKVGAPQIDDTLMSCVDCGGGIWVGPRKKFLASLGFVELRCYACGFEQVAAQVKCVADAGGTTVGIKYVNLAPNRGNRPRR